MNVYLYRVTGTPGVGWNFIMQQGNPTQILLNTQISSTTWKKQLTAAAQTLTRLDIDILMDIMPTWFTYNRIERDNMDVSNQLLATP